MALKTLTHFHYVEILSPTKWDRITSIQYHHERIKSYSFMHYILTTNRNNNIHSDLLNIDYDLLYLNRLSLNHLKPFSNIFLLVYKVLFILNFLVFLLLFPTIVSFFTSCEKPTYSMVEIDFWNYNGLTILSMI